MRIFTNNQAVGHMFQIRLRYVAFLISILLFYHFSLEFLWTFEQDLKQLDMLDLLTNLAIIFSMWICIIWLISFILFTILKGICLRTSLPFFTLVHMMCLFLLSCIVTLHIKNFYGWHSIGTSPFVFKLLWISSIVFLTFLLSF